MYGDGAHSEGLCICRVVSEPLFGPHFRSSGWETFGYSQLCITENGKSEHAGFPQLLNAWKNSSCSASEATLIFALYKTQGVGVGGTNACQMKQGMIVRWKHSA